MLKIVDFMIGKVEKIFVDCDVEVVEFLVFEDFKMDDL